MTLRLLRQRDAALFIAGQSLSSLGDNALWIALAIWVKELTGSSSSAGFAFFALVLGTLTGPVGGLLADRIRRRPLLIATNLATAGFVLLLLLVHDRHRLWLIYLVMFGYGVSASILTPAQNALLPVAVPTGLLAEANAALETLRQGSRLVTPLLGAGLLVALGVGPVVVADAASFAIATAALLALRLREPGPAPGGQRAWTAELAAGARFIRATPELLRVSVAAAVVVIGFGLAESVSFALVDQGLHRSPGFLGVLVTVQGAGAVAAGALGGALIRRAGELTAIRLATASATAGFLLMATAALVPVLLGMALLGAALPWLTVGAVTLFQRRTPSGLLGRATAAFELAVALPQTLAIAAGAVLVAAVDFHLLLLAMAALAAAATACLRPPGAL